MAEYSNDEERLAAIVDFFKHYKNLILSVLISISFIGIGAFGIKFSNDSKNSSASIIYSEWLEDISLDSNNIANDNIFYDKLINEYESTGFAQLAILKKASALAANSQLDESEIYFKQLISLTDGLFGNELINKMARVSLARIYVSKKEFDDALVIIQNLMNGSDAMINEIAGDALLGQNKIELAIEQYNLAKEMYEDEASKNLVIMKLNNIQSVL
jgi:predicted negative regulator of RcsB-dependent stress response